MSGHTKLIKLEDGVIIQVEATLDEAQHVSTAIQKVQQTMDKITPMLVKVCKPLVSAWHELNKDMEIEQAEVELGVSFSGEGDIFIAKTGMEANLTVKLTLKPKPKP